MIKEIIIKKVIQKSPLPKGGIVYTIDPYDGCTIACPYCYQWDDPTWNKDILVKKNIVDVLRNELPEIPRNTLIHIGDRCDPYMDIEKKYKLSRECIKLICKYDIPLFILTKASNNLLRRDIDIFLKYRKHLKIFVGLSNLHDLRKNKNVSNYNNLKIANTLINSGINVHVFITPVLPGITDVEAMINAIDCRIKISLDNFWMIKNSNASKKLLSYIEREYKHLIKLYRKIIYGKKNEYYNYLVKKFSNNNRISFVRDEEGEETLALEMEYRI